MGSEAPRGQRLLTRILDERAAATPDRTYAYIAKPGWRKDGYEPITYGQIATAANHLAHWLDEQLSQIPKPKDGSFQTFGYMGPSDFRYAMVLAASIKSGRRCLIPDPIMTLEARKSLVQRADCVALIAAEEASAPFEAIHNELPNIPLLTIPSERALLAIPPDSVKPYPYTKSYEEGKDDPVCIFHTSGTTGVPKMFTYTNKNFAYIDAIKTLPSTTRKGLFFPAMGSAMSILNTWPAPWSGGIYSLFSNALCQEMTPYSLPPDTPRPLTGAYLRDVLRVVGPHIGRATLTPAVMKQCVEVEGGLEALRALPSLIYAGAPLAQHVGDMLYSHTQVISGYGATETGPLAVLTPTKGSKDWMYYAFHPGSGARMEEHASAIGDNGEALYEIVVDRDCTDLDVMCFDFFPGQKVYRMNDLYARHPVEKDLWRPVGRADDFVKLGWGTKFHAKEFETEIARVRGIKSVVVGGAAKPRPCLLIELDDDDDSKHTMSELWTVLDVMNAKTVDDLKITTELVIVGSDKKPFGRLAKGELNRRSILEAYEGEIEAAYAAARVSEANLARNTT